MTPLRVAFFVTYFPKNSEVFILHQALALLDRGHDVRIHALADPGDAPCHAGTDRFRPSRTVTGRMPSGGGRTLRTFRALPAVLARVPWRDALAALNVNRWGHEALTLHTLFRLDATPGRIECDVAHAQFGDVARQCAFLGERGRLRAPLVASFRGRDISAYLSGARRGVYARVFDRANACLPVSSRGRDRLLALGCPEGRVEVLPSGVSMAGVPRKERWEAGPPRVIAAGRLEAQKGLHLALEVVSRIRASFPGLQMDVFGDGPERARLERRARELGLGDAVRWRGAVAHEDLMAFLPSASLHLFTSVTTPSGQTEGVPNILKETQAAGLPAVAFAHPGVDEVVEDGRTGWLVPEGDVAGMAHRAAALLSDPLLSAEMGRRAAQQSRQRFDLGKVTDRLEAIYQAAIAEGAR